MSAKRPPKSTDRPQPPSQGTAAGKAGAESRPLVATVPPILPQPSASGDVTVGVALASDGSGTVVTARKAGEVRERRPTGHPHDGRPQASLHHLAHAVNNGPPADHGEDQLRAA